MLATLVLLLAATVTCQQKSDICFQKPEEINIVAYAGRRHLQFKEKYLGGIGSSLRISNGDELATLESGVQTASISQILPNNMTNCTTSIKYNYSHDALICNRSVLFLADQHNVTNETVPGRIVQLSNRKDYDCTALSNTNGYSDSKVLVACRDYTTQPDHPSLMLVLYSMGVSTSTWIMQQPGHAIGGDLRLTDAVFDLPAGRKHLLFLWQKDDPLGPRFHLVEMRGFNLERLGFFEPSRTLFGVKESSSIIGMMGDSYNLYLVLWNKIEGSESGTVQVQQCPVPISNASITCSPTNILEFAFTSKVSYLRIETLWQGRIKFQLISKDKMVSAFLIADSPEISLRDDFTLDLSDTGIVEITDASLLEIGTIFLTGRSKEGKQIVSRFIINDKSTFGPESAELPASSSLVGFITGVRTKGKDIYFQYDGRKRFWSGMGEANLIVELPSVDQREKKSFSLQCWHKGTFINSLTFNLEIREDLTDGATLMTSNPASGRVGDTRIPVPVESMYVGGNSPKLHVRLSDPKEGIHVNVEYAQSFVVENDAGLKILDKKLRKIGKNLFYQENSSKRQIYSCKSVKNTFECLVAWSSDSVDSGSKLLSAVLTNRSIVLLHANYLNSVDSDSVQITTLSSFDFSEIATSTIHNTRALQGSLSWSGSSSLQLTVALAGYQGKSPNKFEFMTFQFTNELKGLIETPKKQNQLPITEKLSSFILSNTSALIVTFELESSSKLEHFDIDKGLVTYAGTMAKGVGELCKVGERTYFLDKKLMQINKLGNKLSSIEFDSFSWPLFDYNMTEIVDFHCDEDAKVIQVLGRAGQAYKVITLRVGKDIRRHQRVHSVLDVPSDSKFITSWVDFLLPSSRFTTLVFSKNKPTRYLRYSLNQPVITVDASKATPGDYVLYHTATWTRGDGYTKEYTRVQQLKILPAIKASFNIAPETSTKPLLKPNSILDLEPLLTLTGPVKSLELSEGSPGLKLINRVPEGPTIPGINFERAVISGNLVFGYHESTIQLVENQTAVISIEGFEGLSVEVLDKNKGFAAVAKKQENHLVSYYLVLVWKTAEGWTHLTAQIPISSDPLLTVRLIGDDRILVRGHAVEGFENIQLMYRVAQKELILTHTLYLQACNFGEVKKSEVVAMPGAFLVITSTPETYEGCFESWTVNSQGEAVLSSSKVEALVPGKFNLNQNIDFKCLPYSKSTSARCIFILDGTSSYVINVASSSATSLGLSSTIDATIANPPNFRCIDLDLAVDNVVLLGESLLDGGRLIAVYAFSTGSDVFRIIDASELHTDASKVTVPRFYRDSHNELKFALGGSSTGGLRTFRLEGAKLITTNINQIAADVKIKLTGLSQDVSEVQVSSFLVIPESIPDRSDKFGTAKIIISILLIALLLAFPCYFGARLLMKNRSQDTNILDKLNSSSKIEYEETLKGESQSQSKQDLTLRQSLIEDRYHDDKLSKKMGTVTTGLTSE